MMRFMIKRNIMIIIMRNMMSENYDKIYNKNYKRNIMTILLRIMMRIIMRIIMSENYDENYDVKYFLAKSKKLNQVITTNENFFEKFKRNVQKYGGGVVCDPGQ